MVDRHPNGKHHIHRLCVIRTRADHFYRDQELRFTVHESPDYYQLKISVFTDDKRTDLIGEAWIDLRGIIVPGGGQNDVWQTLSCRGKYAGEIRIEITYYDLRPKPDKPAVKSRQSTPTELEKSSVKPRGPVKRRPLPSDPVTGEAPPVVAATASLPAPPVPAPASAPPALPAAHPNPDRQTPPRMHAKKASLSTFVPSQSPLQAVEYNSPPAHTPRRHPDHHSPSTHTPLPIEYSTPPRNEVARSGRRSINPYDSQLPQDRDYSPQYMHQQEQIEYRGHYSPQQDPYDALPMDDPRQFSPADGERPPPPPPAHRSRNNSSSQELVPRNSYDVSPSRLSHMRHDVLRNEAQRHSVSAYPGRPAFRGYDSAPAANPTHPPNEGYEVVPRHNSYDATYDQNHRSMQPTVEDAPETPSPHSHAYRHSGSRMQQAPEQIGYDEAESPAPLVLRRSPRPSPYRDGYSPTHPSRDYQEEDPYSMSPSHGREYSRSPSSRAHPPHSSQSYHMSSPADMQMTHVGSPGYPPAGVPVALVPGLDANQSQELTDLIYEGRRQDWRQRSHSQGMSTSTRGRPRNESFHGYDHGYDQPPEQAYAVQPYDRRAIAYSSGPEPQMSNARDISPNTRTSPNPHHIKRKSVSPAPSPLEGRRSSEIPFGPDSYDALNPTLVSSKDGTTSPPDFMVSNDTKIITFDGREIDPSDHLPMESWAPEPEKNGRDEPPPPEPRSRLTGAQPLPPSTRRQPRAGRHSMSAINSYTFEDPRTPPPSGSRARLQKRSNPVSAGNSLAASSPLAPISKDNYQERQGYSSLRGLPRAGTWDRDFENDHRGPMYGAPPVPAKVPLALMSGANGSGTELALLEEMQQIDIGAGRSRRRGGY